MCAEGYYQTLTGRSSCTKCPVGKYCQSPSAKPVECPLDANCPAGSTKPMFCKKWYYYSSSKQVSPK